MLDGSGVKAMPETIPEPNSGSLWKKIQVAKWGTHTHKKNPLKLFLNSFLCQGDS